MQDGNGFIILPDNGSHVVTGRGFAARADRNGGERAIKRFMIVVIVAVAALTVLVMAVLVLQIVLSIYAAG